ncbi:isopeptide-forming domain-containing fimbrial protein [Bifidobacterium sp. ESL0764]|uniref:isopeptide-forming domain-containing fimbrial protein n=1 Tax=Bifidobacterium sp. ESL0764 TaxID=2983228 RepID=UPI0023F8345C|nr:isopeptide-forming domain-containing fimbrial protein [Bifidobacterium sp. ESL0764]WEV65736.1 isopeptide-forming domain-containing fimbrial protein [Bifidobacterium sp. ESL0764]
MSRKFNVRGVVGLTLAAATLLALAPLGTANAADPVSIDMSKAKKTSITIKSTKASMTNHKFAALKIGQYDQATHDGDDLKSVTVSTVDGIKDAAKTALDNVRGSATADSAYAGNPVGEVASKWLGYGTTGDDTTSNTSDAVGTDKHGYNGKLRSFVTQFAKQDGIPAKFTAPSAPTANCGPGTSYCVVDGDNETATIKNLEPGVYVVEDITSVFTGEGTGHKNSIPMLVSTGIEMSTTEKYMTLNGNKLGQIDMKNDTPTVTKTLNKDATDYDPSIGGTLSYQLKSQVPLTTGFDHYVYAMTDHPGTGLTYKTDSDPVVKVCPSDSINDSGCETLTATTDYMVTHKEFAAGENGSTGRVGDTHYILFDLTKSIRDQKYKDYIFITYKMTVNENAVSEQPLRNGIRLEYSNDSNNPPSTDVPTPTDDGTIKDCPAGSDTSTCKDGSIYDDGSGDGEGAANADTYFRHFDLINLKKVDGAGLAGAKFTVTDSDGKLVNFKKVDNGSYKKSTDQTNTDTTKEPTTTVAGAQLEVYKTAPSTNANSDDPSDDGQLRVDGLKDGTYTVKETVAAPGFSSTFLPSTDVYVGALGTGDDAKKSAFANTADTLGLIAKHGDASVDPKVLNEVKMTKDSAAGADDAGAVIVDNVTSVSQLPLTGGAGVVLGLLVLVAFGATAGVLIVVRRRLNA